MAANLDNLLIMTLEEKFKFCARISRLEIADPCIMEWIDDSGNHQITTYRQEGIGDDVDILNKLILKANNIVDIRE